ncbi:tetratricopeptide repeat protein [Blastopirellula marina]|uniref:Uncharacterized protein n=1 Tax=Blastopirellula marina TaxID=124 RepID=A0A2S8GNA1_9BACT|nr:tetratricopeptide repeat protein [Blastopirellula marina]PQO45905.1 hypothetical protein C5Y93_11665 [Blastopirellula marina]
MRGCLTLWFCLWSAVAVGHEVGDTVYVVSEAGVELKSSDGVATHVSQGMPLKVLEVEGERLHLQASWDKKVAWIKTDQVAAADQADQRFSAAIEEKPTAGAYLARAQVKFANDDRVSALEDVNAAIRLNPQSSAALNFRAWLWLHRMDYDQAIADCDAAILLDPNLTLAYVCRGRAKYKKGRSFDAIDDFDAAIRLDPTRSNVFHNRGVAHLENRNGERAADDFTEAIRLGADDALVYCNRGLANRRQRKYGEALSDFEDSIMRDPQDAWSYANAAWIYATCPEEKWRDGKRGVELALKACELSQGNVTFHRETLAAAYAEAGEFDEAIETQEAIVRKTPKSHRENYEETLRLYKKGRPYRESP